LLFFIFDPRFQSRAVFALQVFHVRIYNTYFYADLALFTLIIYYYTSFGYLQSKKIVLQVVLLIYGKFQDDFATDFADLCGF